MTTARHSMRSLCCLAMLAVSCMASFAQTPVRLNSTLGAGGSSRYVVSGGRSYLVQQSIGQASVTGTVQTPAHALRQGFIQPHDLAFQFEERAPLQVAVYPNPFYETFTARLHETTTRRISVIITDLFGRIVFTQEFQAVSTLLLEPGALASGQYILKVYDGRKHCISKLIKH